MKHKLPLVVVVLACSICSAADRFFEIPAAFEKDPGIMLVLGGVKVADAPGPKSKTLKAWGKQATTARSKVFRLEGVLVLRTLVSPPARQSNNGAPDTIRLADEETAEIRKLAIQIVDSTDDFVVWQSLEMLKVIGDESCCKAVAVHANTPSVGQAEIGRLACEILGKFPCESSIPALVRAAEMNSGEHAIAAIAKIGGDKARDALEKLSKSKLGREGTPTGEAIAKALDEIESRE